MKNKINIITDTIIICACALTLNGCASIVNGTTQTVKVTTPPTKNARCELTNSVGTWFLKSTPGMVEVHHAKGPLTVTCNKTGYASAKTSVKSSMSAAVFGNILVGGIIGAAADTADGAAYKYPSDIAVPMHKSKHQQFSKTGKLPNNDKKTTQKTI